MEEWPPQSPDMCPLDYAIWAMMAAADAGLEDSRTIHELRAKVLAASAALKDTHLTVMEQFPKRLRQCVLADGWWFEGAPKSSESHDEGLDYF